jgi:signal transduction histidine kinase
MRTPRRWWSRRTLRIRISLAAAGPLAVALVLGTVAVVAVFSAGRVRDLDAQTRVESDTLVALVSDDRLPTTLPAPAGSTLLAQVLADDGTVLAATPSASRVQPLLQVATRGGRSVVTDEDGGYAGVPLRLRIRSADLDGRSVRVVVAAPLTDVRRALRALQLVLLLVVPLLIVGATAVVWWVTGLALRPVERLRAAAADLAADPGRSPAPPLPVPDADDEVARLGRTLDGLVIAVRHLVAREREFVADAAHELRAPVASMRVQIDVARAHPTIVDLPVLLQDLDHEVDRLSALTADLLALGRAGSRADSLRVAVDLRALAGAEGDHVMVLGDPESLARLVDNLVTNAHRYGHRTRVTTTELDGAAVLDVDDDGPGIAVEDRGKVFDRWVRLDSARTRSAGGAGLGLALVREIARAHGGEVSVETSPLGGARLRVTLPLHQRQGQDRAGS